MRMFTCCLVPALLMAGCAANGSVGDAVLRPVVAAPQGAQTRPVALHNVVGAMHRGDVVGAMMGGWACVRHGDIVWEGGLSAESRERFLRAFGDEMQKANYRFVGGQQELFEDTSRSQAELVVGGRIEQLQESLCRGDFDAVKGGAYLRVHWEIYDVLQRKVVYQTTTEGAYKTETSSRSGSVRVYLANAFDMAVQNLLADDGFHALIQQAPVAAEVPGSQPIDFTPATATAPASPGRISAARAASVTVSTAMGHGSGVVISPQGYVLTNQHVVEQAHRVRVKLATEREVVGTVLRVDSARDVALIKLEEVNLPAATLRVADAPQVGDEVYAIGAPYSDTLDLTVTRGVVSAYRTRDGLRFIQSDVAVHPGNSGGPLVDANGDVVGLCVLGLAPEGVSSSLNFFIPIGEALNSLGLHMASGDVPAAAATSTVGGSGN